ncbi:MAG: hypothetical protein P9L94_13540 [Candidatus Hinthialibacter antarcticus]|nr:hypothetical protein [Candidatus Hinthialibacter antarcticus]
METVLQTIAKQANLDRILFTPALKKIYFDMAVGSGGATQFKHADTIRNGLTFAADKARDKKHVLLFCAVHELVHSYDMLLKTAHELTPVVVLAVNENAPGSLRDAGSFLPYSNNGWLQFHTHTLQELYDHLALAYHLIHDQKEHPPFLIFHSAVNHDDLGEFAPREDIDMGNPLTGLQTSAKTDEDPFAAAMAAVENKTKEKITLRGLLQKTIGNLREGYTEFGYDLPGSGFPIVGEITKGNWAVITCLPPAGAPDDYVRPLCRRPFIPDGLAEYLKKKKVIAVVEPLAAPGCTVPPFFAELAASLGAQMKARFLSIQAPPNCGILYNSDQRKIEGLIEEAASDAETVYHTL